MTSTPALTSPGEATPDTYGVGERILFTVTFNGEVDVAGDPVFRFALGSSDVDAALDSGTATTGTDALVFAYTVLSSDEDDNGIYLRDEDDFNNPDGPVRLDSDDTIRLAGTSTDVPLYWEGRGRQDDHKVDGSLRASNSPPVFAALHSRIVPENSGAGTNVGAPVTAEDDDDDTLEYSLEGTDAASFAIDSATGQITTVANLNYEVKDRYVVTVKADDGFTGGTDTVPVTISVMDVDEQSATPAAPTLAAVSGSSTSLDATWDAPGLNGGPAITGYNLEYRIGATGDWTDFPHTGTEVTATITGLTANTEYQARVQALNGETPSDWSDPSDAERTNRVNNPPAFTSATLSIEENSTTSSRLTVEAVDNDTGDDVTGYDITGGADQSFFSIDATTGALTFATAPDFEDPEDQGADNTYEVTVQATSGTGDREATATQTIAVMVTDAAEKPGKPTGLRVAKVSGSTTSLTATWTEPGLNGGPAISGYDVEYRLGSGGAWMNVPHAGMAVTATITGLTADTWYRVRVRAKNEELDSDWSDISGATTHGGPPEVTSATVGESGTNIIFQLSRYLGLDSLEQVSKQAFTLTVDSTNVSVHLVLREAGGGASASRLHVAVLGTNVIYRGQQVVVSYDSSVDLIGDGDGEFSVESFTTGSGGVPAVVNNSTQDHPSGNNAPSITSPSAFDAAENQTAAGTVVATDGDADDAVTGYALTGGADQSLLSIDSATGALTFATAPDFEDAQDQGSDNTYVVEVTATSGTGTREETSTQTVAVRVTNADEGQSGTVTIDDTAPTVGDELTASTADVADPDGLPDPFTPAWRWYRTPMGGSETAIPGAASAMYMVVEADLNATLTARASWTDKGAFANTLSSAPTSAVAAAGALPTLSIGDAEDAEDAGVEFTATLTAGVSGKVTATWTATIESGDTASAADLATTKTGDVEFVENATSAKFTVPVNDDTIDEDNETFTVTLSGVSTNAQLAADPTATGTIEDDDDPPTITVENYTWLEGDPDPDPDNLLDGDPGYPFKVTLSEASEKRILFRVRSATDGTATDADLRSFFFAGRKAISAGEEFRHYPALVINDDALDEDDETFTMEIYDLENVTAGAQTKSTITITDDDPTPTVTVADASATEGDKVGFVVTLSAVSGRDVEVGYATSVATGQTATSDTDFTAATGTLTILASDSTATGTVEVQTTEDDASESAETFTLTLSATKNVALGTPSTATGTINDDDAADDCPNDTTTACAVDVGGSATGTIETEDDLDWFKVELEAGTRYQIDMEGLPTSRGTMSDPNLVVRSAAFAVLATDDDGGVGANSRVIYTPTTAGTHYLEARAVNDDTGAYTLSVIVLGANGELGGGRGLSRNHRHHRPGRGRGLGNGQHRNRDGPGLVQGRTGGGEVLPDRPGGQYWRRRRPGRPLSAQYPRLVRDRDFRDRERRYRWRRCRQPGGLYADRGRRLLPGSKHICR